MATKIITKNSSTATSIPTAGDLVQGELAVNVTDKRLFTEDSGGAIVELGTNPSTLTSGAATFSGTVYTEELEIFAADNLRLRFLNGVTFKGGIQVATTAADMIATSAVDDLAIRSQANILFSTGGNTERLRIDSNGVLQSNGYSVVASSARAASGTLRLGNIASTSMLLDYDDQGQTIATVRNQYGSLSPSAELSLDSGFITFNTGTSFTESARLDASGNLLVGKTANDNTTAGHRFTGSGFASHVVANDYPLLLNRLSSDGPLLTLRKDSATVGSIGAQGGAPYITGPLAGGVKFSYLTSTNATIFPVTTTGATADNLHDLGYVGSRFRDLHLSGGVYLGGTGAANKLDDYEEGSFTATASQGTIQNTYCKYIKVGNLVTVSGNVDVFSDRTSSTTIAILGLPFAVKSGTLATNGVMTDYISGSVSTHVYAGPGTSSMTLYQSNTSAALNPVSYSQLTSVSSGFYFTFTYTTV